MSATGCPERLTALTEHLFRRSSGGGRGGGEGVDGGRALYTGKCATEHVGAATGIKLLTRRESVYCIHSFSISLVDVGDVNDSEYGFI